MKGKKLHMFALVLLYPKCLLTVLKTEQWSRWALGRDYCSSSFVLRKNIFASFLVFLPRMLTHSQRASLNESEFLPGIQSKTIWEMGSPVTPSYEFRTEVQRGELCCLWERRELNTGLLPYLVAQAVLPSQVVYS